MYAPMPPSLLTCFNPMAVNAQFWTAKESRITRLSQLRINYGAEDRSRTYTPVKEADFESAASTIPPLRHRRASMSNCTRTTGMSQAVYRFNDACLGLNHLSPFEPLSYNSSAR